jgi:hypothetical protein
VSESDEKELDLIMYPLLGKEKRNMIEMTHLKHRFFIRSTWYIDAFQYFATDADVVVFDYCG